MYNIRNNKYRMTIIDFDGKHHTKTIEGFGNMKDVRKTARKMGVKIVSLKKVKS